MCLFGNNVFCVKEYLKLLRNKCKLFLFFIRGVFFYFLVKFSLIKLIREKLKLYLL